MLGIFIYVGLICAQLYLLTSVFYFIKALVIFYERWTVLAELITDKANIPCFFRMSILNIVAREILDSRGNPTVEVDLHTDKGIQ